MQRKIFHISSLLFVHCFTILLCVVSVSKPLINTQNAVGVFDASGGLNDDLENTEQETDSDKKELTQDDYFSCFNFIPKVISSAHGTLFSVENETCSNGFILISIPPPKEYFS